jgi:hypothetical protein
MLICVRAMGATAAAMTISGEERLCPLSDREFLVALFLPQKADQPLLLPPETTGSAR